MNDIEINYFQTVINILETISLAAEEICSQRWHTADTGFELVLNNWLNCLEFLVFFFKVLVILRKYGLCFLRKALLRGHSSVGK